MYVFTHLHQNRSNRSQLSTAYFCAAYWTLEMVGVLVKILPKILLEPDLYVILEESPKIGPLVKLITVMIGIHHQCSEPTYNKNFTKRFDIIFLTNPFEMLLKRETNLVFRYCFP